VHGDNSIRIISSIFLTLGSEGRTRNYATPVQLGEILIVGRVKALDNHDWIGIG
jgi:hypothetical protein